MSARVTRSRSKQAGGEPAQPSSAEATPAKRSVSGRKRKSKTDADDKAEPTLQLEAAGDGDKQAGEQLKLVASDEQRPHEAEQPTQPAEEGTERKEGDSGKNGHSKESEDSKQEGGPDEGWQDGHDDAADYHEPQDDRQLVTLQQTDHRTADHASPTLPDDIDLSPVIINRAPVLTLWAAVLAHVGPARLPWLSALTVGKAIAGMLAQSRGRALGIFEPSQHPHKRPKTSSEQDHTADDVHVLGIAVHMARLGDHTYATVAGKPINASQCDRYIHQHFGTERPRVIATMRYLAHCLLARGVDGQADVEGRYSFGLYEQFRPTVAGGQAPGWGQKGELDLTKMVEMGRNELEIAKTEGTQLRLTTEKEQQEERAEK